MVEAKCKVYLASTNSWHFDVWLEEDGKRLGYPHVASGCEIGLMKRRAKEACTKKANRAAKKLLKQYDYRASQEDEVYTLTLDGKPSYASLQSRIAELEKELEL